MDYIFDGLHIHYYGLQWITHLVKMDYIFGLHMECNGLHMVYKMDYNFECVISELPLGLYKLFLVFVYDLFI